MELFHAHHARLFRFAHRLCGDAGLADDVVQEAFVRLARRGSMPEMPEAWLITVVLNRVRNEHTTRARRLRLLTASRAEQAHGDAPPPPERAAESAETIARVRAALDGLRERDRHLLLLHAEGYGYLEMARVLGLRESSVGVFLARARRAFRARYEEGTDAPR